MNSMIKRLMWVTLIVACFLTFAMLRVKEHKHLEAVWVVTTENGPDTAYYNEADANAFATKDQSHLRIWRVPLTK